MARQKIPSKQLHRAGSFSDLQEKLSDREIGFCDDDRTAYICREHRDGRKLIPLSRMFVATYGVTSCDDIQVAFDAGLVVMLRGLTVMGGTTELLMTLTSVQASSTGYNTYRFSSSPEVYQDGALFYWATLQGDTWANGAKTLAGLT